MATVHYVTWDYPGLVFPEEKSESIATRDVEALTIPDGVYAFRFWDREERLVNGEVLKGAAKNRSGRYVLGVVYSLDEIKDNIPQLGESDHRVLLTNMEVNKYAHVVRCPAGNWQPLLDTDVLIPGIAGAGS
jgi:hypothetical protein